MKIQTRHLLALWLLGLFTTAHAALPSGQQQHEANLDSLYALIDQAITEFPVFVAKRERDIDMERSHLQQAATQEDRFGVAERLFWLFKPFKNDSALHYAQLCIDLADSLHRPDIVGHYRSLMARQCSNAGMYVESSGLLQQVDKTTLDHEGLTDYYDACMHVCGEVAAYTLLPQVRATYYAEQDHYRDSLLEVAPAGSSKYLQMSIVRFVARHQLDKALEMSDVWLNKASEKTHDDAMATYYRHIVYAWMGNKKMTRYWLAKSALDDIRCAIRDQASLIILAQLLNEDGNWERSYRYIRFTWDCNQQFNTRMRASQIAPVLNVIEKDFLDASSRNRKTLITSSVVFVLLTMLLLALLYYVRYQQKQLAQAYSELTDVNEQLVKSNNKLTWMNTHIKRYNKELFDINYELRMEKEQMQSEEERVAPVNQRMELKKL